MIKFYLYTVVIYFIIYITSGIFFRKEFRIARDKLRKETNNNSKIYSKTRTTFTYLTISFIPIIRLLFLIGKFYLIFDPDEYIKKTNNK